jgi:hypothetical protein
MNSKSNPQLDQLIKRIYSSYIDIKSGDFKDIDKDILLADISQLYISIKEMYTNHDTQINALEQEIMNEKMAQIPIAEPINVPPVVTEPIEIVSTDVLNTETPLQSLIAETIENKTIEPVIDEPKIISTESDFDLTMFMDDDDISTLTAHPFDSNKVEAKHIAVAPNTTETSTDPTPVINANPVLESKLESNFDQYKSIPNLSEAPIASVVTEVKSVTEIQPERIIEPTVDTENKSAGKIMDFLHDGEVKNVKDIYSFLDINTRIGLVELFFKGNSLELTDALVKINKLNTKEECIAVVNKYATQFGIKETDDIFQTFTQLINRKFTGF